MFRRAAASALLALAVGCGSSGAGALATTLPAGVPPTAVLADWERIDGAYETKTDRVQYALFVDPERPAVYRLTQFRVTAYGDAPAEETLIWNATPDRPGPVRCYAEQRTRTWRTLWLVPLSSWREVRPATPEFRGSMQRAIEIYYRVHAEGRAGPPVSAESPRS